MRIEFKAGTTGKEPTIIMVYDVNPPVVMSTAKVFSRMNLKGSGQEDKEEIFVPLNMYLNSPQVPEKARALVYNINKAMVEIDKNSSDINANLVSYGNALSDLLDEPAFREESILKWTTSTLRAPPTAEDTYDASKEGRHTRYSTYLKGEYYRLMALTIFMRISLVVFVAMIKALGTVHEDKVKKLKVLDHIPKKMKQLKSYKRLYKYIKSFSDKVIIKAEDSLSLSFDDENKIDMLLSVVLFHVLVSGRVVNIDENRHIVSLMYNKIAGDNSLNSYSKTSIGQKRVVDNTEEDNSSVFESYRSVADRTIAEQVNMSYRGSEEYLVGMIGHLLDETEYRLIMTDIKNQSLYVNKIHLNLMHVILKDIVTPEAFSFISKANVKHMLVMSHLLIKEKHPYLATIMMANSREDLKMDDSEYYIAPSTLSFNVPPAIKEEIVARYPVEGILHPSIKEHPVIQYVFEISKACSTEVWVVKPSRPWFRKSPLVKESIVKPNNNVAELVWDLIKDSDNIITDLKTIV